MIDAPGPWGSGPFTLTEGHSAIRNRVAIINADPFACTWIDDEQDRTDRVVLEANPDHWNAERGPRLERVVYRNDVTPAEALDLVCDADGEVDIVSEVSPADAARVDASEHAHLVAVDAMRVLVGMINRGADDVPLDDVRARRALNLAVHRDRLVRDGLAGYATPLAGLTPPWAAGFPEGQQPYPHDPERARSLLAEAGWPAGRALLLSAPPELAPLAELIAEDYRAALGIDVEAIVPPAERVPALLRRLVEKKLPLPWDVCLHAWLDLSADAPPAVMHREFFGATGAFRAGPPLPEFDRMLGVYVTEIDPGRFDEIATRIDRYCYDEALAVFLCSPKALYAVNDHVRFVGYRATFELAETEVDDMHWSLR